MAKKKSKFEDRGKDNKDWTWAEVNDQVRPVKSYRDITKGRRKGDVEVTLFDGKKKVVRRKQVRFAGDYLPTGKVGSAFVYECAGG